MKGRFVTAEALETALTDHQRWLKSEGREGIRANFSGWNLNGKNLRDADLRHACLSRARFIWADLRSANLSFADVTGALFNHADLTGSLFIGSRLNGAVFRRASLEGSVFEEAIISHVDFRETCFAETYPSFELASDDLNAARHHLTEALTHLFHALWLGILYVYEKIRRMALRRYIAWRRAREGHIRLSREKEFT